MRWVGIRSAGDAVGDRLRIDYIQGDSANTRLAFTFTNWAPPGVISLDGSGYAGKFLLDHGFDVVAFKSSRNYWFQDVVSEDFARIEQALAASGRAYRRRVGYGSSMGGYAACQFARALRLDRVLAFSPQFAINGDWDQRWAREAAAITFCHALTADQIALGCHFVVAYDSRGPDIDHIRRLAAIVPAGHLHEICLRYSGHPTGDFIAQTGHLKAFALAVLRDEVAPPLTAIRRDRGRSPAYLRTLAAACAEHGKPRLALALIDRAIAINAASPLYHWQRSLILHCLGRIDDSVAAGRAAFALAPNEAPYALHLTHLLAKQGDGPAALAVLDRAIALDPGNAGSFGQRATLLGHQGDFAGAAQAQRQAIALDPANAHRVAFLSHLLVHTGAIAEALATIDRAIALDPTVAGFHNHRSALLDRIGRVDQAVEAAEHAVALTPTDPAPLVQLSQVLARKGQLEAALDCAARAVHRAPDIARYHRHLGALQEYAGRLDLAIDATRQAIRLEPNVPGHAEHLAALLRRRGQAGAAAAD